MNIVRETVPRNTITRVRAGHMIKDGIYAACSGDTLGITELTKHTSDDLNTRGVTRRYHAASLSIARSKETKRLYFENWLLLPRFEVKV